MNAAKKSSKATEKSLAVASAIGPFEQRAPIAIFHGDVFGTGPANQSANLPRNTR